MEQSGKAHKRHFLGGAFVLAFAVMLLVFPEASLKGARIGLSRWWDVVLPSLFPFMVMSTLLLETRFFNYLGYVLGKTFSPFCRLSGSAVSICLLGGLGGYPIGARLGGDLFDRHELDSRGLLLTLLVGNVASPVFILGAVATGFLGTAAIGVPMLLGYNISVWITGFLFSRLLPATPAKQSAQPKPSTMDFSGALIRSMQAMLSVGGCMILATSLLCILGETGVLTFLQAPVDAVLSLLSVPKSVAMPLMQGLLEMTTGCAAMAQIQAPLLVRASFCVGICAFGGVSVLMQTRSFAKVPLLPLVMGKLVNAILAVACTALLIKLFLPEAVTAFAPIAVPAPGNQWLFALVLLAVTGIPLMITALYANISRRSPHLYRGEPKQKPAHR